MYLRTIREGQHVNYVDTTIMGHMTARESPYGILVPNCVLHKFLTKASSSLMSTLTTKLQKTKLVLLWLLLLMGNYLVRKLRWHFKMFCVMINGGGVLGKLQTTNSQCVSPMPRWFKTIACSDWVWKTAKPRWSLNLGHHPCGHKASCNKLGSK